MQEIPDLVTPGRIGRNLDHKGLGYRTAPVTPLWIMAGIRASLVVIPTGPARAGTLKTSATGLASRPSSVSTSDGLATLCTFGSNRAPVGLPASVPCTSGPVSVVIRLPVNADTKAGAYSLISKVMPAASRRWRSTGPIAAAVVT